MSSPSELNALVYGWTILYRPEQYAGVWVADECEDGIEEDSLPDAARGNVPAFYLDFATAADRRDYLVQRGLSARVVALLVEPSDIEGVSNDYPA